MGIGCYHSELQVLTVEWSQGPQLTFLMSIVFLPEKSCFNIPTCVIMLKWSGGALYLLVYVYSHMQVGLVLFLAHYPTVNMLSSNSKCTVVPFYKKKRRMT